MGWKKRANEHLIVAKNSLDEADESMSYESASRRTDVIGKQIARGFVEAGLALAELYAGRDVEGKRQLRAFLGADVVDVAVRLAVERGVKEAA